MEQDTKIEIRKKILLFELIYTCIVGIVNIDIYEKKSKNDNGNSEEVSVENSYIYNVKYDDGKEHLIDSLSNLDHVTEATIVLNNEDDYSYLNSMPNLEKLTIIDCGDNGNVLDNVLGTTFKRNISIGIYAKSGYITFNDERYGFIKNISYIDTLMIGKLTDHIGIDSAFLESLTNVHNLEINLDHLSNYHYSDLTFLDSLKVSGLPYDIAMFFSKDDLNNLIVNGVKLDIDNKEKVVEAVNRIDDIIKNLNISDDMTDLEKLNIILSYVMEICSYDKEVSKKLEDDTLGPINYKPFYGDGHLTGILENDTQICGNYAALLYILSHYVGLDTYYMHSNNHAWNAIKIGDYYYYIDPTYIDQQKIIRNSYIIFDEVNLDDDAISEYYLREIGKPGFKIQVTGAELLLKEGNQSEINQLDWYLVDPTEVIDKSHVASFIPEGMEIEEIPDDEEITKVKRLKY